MCHQEFVLTGCLWLEVVISSENSPAAAVLLSVTLQEVTVVHCCTLLSVSAYLGNFTSISGDIRVCEL